MDRALGSSRAGVGEPVGGSANRCRRGLKRWCRSRARGRWPSCWMAVMRSCRSPMAPFGLTLAAPHDALNGTWFRCPISVNLNAFR